MVTAQGGSLRSFDKTSVHEPKFRKKIFAEKEGFITGMNTLELGKAVVQLGGGRLKKGDSLDPTVGMFFHKKIGSVVKAEEPLMEIFCSDAEKLKMVYEGVKGAIQIRVEKTINHPLILS